MIKVSKTNMPGVLTIVPDIFIDHRGFYTETFNVALYKEHGIDIDFVQDDISVSFKNVLRGIHGDNKTWKLISCLLGKFYFVVVDCDKSSKNFGKWQSFLLSDENRMQILVPPNHGNAHFVLSTKVIFNYKQSEYYDPESQFSYRWDSPRFNIKWPIKNPILSKRDEEGKFIT